jgi:hypothetical protein
MIIHPKQIWAKPWRNHIVIGCTFRLDDLQVAVDLGKAPPNCAIITGKRSQSRVFGSITVFPSLTIFIL